MATSSSPLVLFIDTDHDTHFSLTIDGDQSIAQLKRRIISDHANCFPEFGEISVTAVKAKRGEFSYHLSDFMILNCFFQDAERDVCFQVDILCVSSTIKSSEQIKTSTDAPMHEQKFKKLKHLHFKSGDGASASFAAKMNEKVQFDTLMKDSQDLWIKSVKEKELFGDGKNLLVYDSLQMLSNNTPLENPVKENFPKVSINNCNEICSDYYKYESLQLNNSLKDSTDTRKKKKKISNNEENLAGNNSSDLEHRRKKKKKVSSNKNNPLVNDSMHKINDTASQNLTKEISPQEAVCKNNANGIDSNKSEIVASFNECSCHNNLQPMESTMQASLGIDFEIAAEHGARKVHDASHEGQTKMAIDAHMEKNLLETNEAVNLNFIHEAPFQFDTNTSMKDHSDDLKLKREKKTKVSRNQDFSHNPLVEDSLYKLNPIRADNQTKEGIVKEAISKESSQSYTIRHAELLLQSVVDDKHNRKEKFSEVPSPSNLLNNTSSNLDSSMHETIVSSAGLMNCDLTATDKISKHDRIKSKSKENDTVVQISNDPTLQISKEGFGNVRLDTNIKEITPTQMKKQRCLVKKIPNSRFGIVSNKSNEDELVPTIMLSEKKDGIGSNRHGPEKAISGSRTKDKLNIDLGNTKASPVEYGESSICKMDDALHNNQTKMDIDARMKKRLPETEQDMNCIFIHEAPVQLDTNTSMKDPSDLKPKRKKKKKKVSRNQELSHNNPLVEDSLHKVNYTLADNQPKMSIVKEPISKEKSQPSKIDHAESLLQTTVDDKHNRKEKVSKVQPPSKLLNNTSTDLDSSMHGAVVSSTGLIYCDNTAPDKISKHEHIKNRSRENDPIMKIWNDQALRISKEGFTNGNNVRSNKNIKKIAPTETKKQRREAKKNPSSRSGNVLKKSNEDELASTFMLNEKNDGSGSNRHALEKANSGCRTKADSNVDLDNAKLSPEVILYQKEKKMVQIKENDNQLGKSDVILKRRIPSAKELKRMHTSCTKKKRPKRDFKFQVKSKIQGNEEKRKSVTLKAAEKMLDAYKRLSPDNSWVAPPSCYKLLQESHCFDPWRVLVICMLLNVTQGRQAKAILPAFFKLVPDAEAATKVLEKKLRKLIRPLGLYNKRAALIKQFSAEYLSPDWTHVTCLPGVNKYAADAYAIFCAGRPEDVIPCDHKLVDYWKFLLKMRAQDQEN